MSKKFILLLCIVIFGTIIRFIWIDRIPHSVNNDELHYLLSAKSFALTGKDISQSVSPLDILMFRYPKNELVQAELPYFTDLLTVGWLPLSLIGNAIPNVIFSLGIIFIMYLISKNLLGEKIGLISAFLTAINPWFIAMGRTSYEVIPATFFYLCAFYVLLVIKGWRIFISLPFFLLAFYSYIGTKVIFLPFVFVLCVYSYFFVNKKKFLKQYLVLLFILTVFVGFFIFQLKTIPQTSRMSEILTPNSPFISDQVDFIRKTTIIHPFLSIFENKITIFIKVIFSNVFNSFSPIHLFQYGDYFFSLGKHGLFYLVDPIFLLLGFSVLFWKNRKILFLLLFFIGIAIIPEIFHASSLRTGEFFSPHIALLVPFFIIIIATGVWYVVNASKNINKYILSMIVVLYLLFFANFIHVYFFQIPLLHNFYNFPDRLLAKYIELSNSNKEKIFIYTPDQRGLFNEYLFYSNKLNKDNALEIAKSLQDSKYKIDNVSFLSCNNKLKNFGNDSLAIVDSECAMSIDQSNLSIPQLSDSGGVYKIINDRLCRKYELKQYVSGFRLNDFNIEKMTPRQFCQTFIVSI